MKTLIVRFLKEDDGASTIEYIFNFSILMGFAFFIFNIIVAYFIINTTENAAQRGARFAAVRPPAVTGMPAVNQLAPGATPGGPCTVAGNCVPPTPATWSCRAGTIGACDFGNYEAIWREINRISPPLTGEEVEITYYYAQLGFAGGPFTPIVEVSITPDWQLFFFQFSDFSFLPTLRATAIATGLGNIDDRNIN
jgi:hypothetical protein